MNQLCMYQVPRFLCKRLGVGRGGQRHRFVDVCHALCAELSVRPGRFVISCRNVAVTMDMCIFFQITSVLVYNTYGTSL